MTSTALIIAGHIAGHIAAASLTNPEAAIALKKEGDLKKNDAATTMALMALKLADALIYQERKQWGEVT